MYAPESVTNAAPNGTNVTQMRRIVTMCVRKGTNVTEPYQTVTTWVRGVQRQKKFLIFVEVKISGAG